MNRLGNILTVLLVTAPGTEAELPGGRNPNGPMAPLMKLLRGSHSLRHILTSLNRGWMFLDYRSEEVSEQPVPH